MGLDLRVKGYYSKNSKIGSYSGFHDFRIEWARHLGFEFEEMEGSGGTKPYTNEPLEFFFNHSDCDGSLTPEQCGVLLEQAEKDYPVLKEKSERCAYSFPILIEFCREAVIANETLEFQ